MGLLSPVSGDYTITSGYGGRVAPTVGASTSHMGIDISVPVGTNVRSSAAGTVTYVGSNNAQGNFIKIDHGNGIETMYQHLQSISAKVGQSVFAGQNIALSGNTGRSTGPHLHFEVFQNGKNINPATALTDDSINASYSIDNVNIDGMLDVVKKYWYVIAGGMLVIALLK